MTAGKVDDANGPASGRSVGTGPPTAKRWWESKTFWVGFTPPAFVLGAFFFFYVSGAQTLQLSHDGKTFKVSLAREPLTAEQLKRLLAGEGKNAQSAAMLKAMLAEAGFVPIDGDLSPDVVQKLKRKGLHPIDQPGIADELAKRFENLYDGESQQDLFERHKSMQKALESLPSLKELRTRAREQDRPFQPIAISAWASKPEEMSARPACMEVVKVSGKTLAGKVITIVNPEDWQKTLTAHAQPSGVLNLEDETLVNLSEDQFSVLGIVAATESLPKLKGKLAKILVVPVPAEEAREVPTGCGQTKSARTASRTRRS